MTKPDAKPCPFCGGEGNIHLALPSKRVKDKSFTVHAMNCRDCGALGPWGNNKTEAIEAWNERD